MKTKDLAKISSITAITQVLGCLLKEPNILEDQEYKITIDDFPQKFHKIIFGCINNLLVEGCKDIDEVTIVNYLEQSPLSKQEFLANNGIEYLDIIQEKSNIKNFKYNYELLKKYTKLREIATCGMDISDIYDINEVDPKLIEEQNKRLNKMSVADICNYFNSKLSTACESYLNENGVMKYTTSNTVRDTINNLGKTRIGIPFTNSIITTATKGKVLGNLILESTGTGGLKSRKAIKEAIDSTIGEYYDVEKKAWVKTNRPKQKALFICTELDQDDINIVALGYLSGIDTEKIELAKFTDEEAERIEYATRLMEENPLYIVLLPEYDIADLTNVITNHVVQYGVKYCWVDYIHENGKLLSSTQMLSGTGLRTDQILLQVATALKNIALRLKIFIYASVQQNALAEGDTEDARGIGSIRGSRALADKCNVVMVTFRPKKRDIEKLMPILKGFGIDQLPNYAYSLAKNRGSKLTACYVWTYMDAGNMRETPIMATTYGYEPIEVSTLEIAFENNDDKLEVTHEQQEEVENKSMDDGLSGLF